MCKPLPLKHAAAEPYMDLLRSQKAGKNVIPRGLLSQAAEARELFQAAREVAISRALLNNPRGWALGQD